MRTFTAATISAVLALAGCGSEPYSEPREAAEAYVEAFRDNDVEVYCPRIRMSVFGGLRDAPLGGPFKKACEDGELFETFGAVDVRTEVGRSRVTEVTVEGDRASAELSRDGAMGLERQKGTWVVTCLASGAQVRANPGTCSDG